MRKQSIDRTKAFTRLMILSVIIALTAVSAGVLAKYITTLASANKQANTAEFYFLTDPNENGVGDPYPVYDGTLSFVVKNHDHINNAERDITYTVTVISHPIGSNCVISVNGTTASGGTLTRDVQSNDNVEISTDKDGDYTVEIASTSPYEKTITLYFRVNTHYADSFYTVTQHVGWIELDLYTGEDGDNVIVSYGSLQPDNTIDLTADWTASSGSGTLTGILPYSHYKLIFFGTYTGEDPFAVSTVHGKAIVKGA